MTVIVNTGAGSSGTGDTPAARIPALFGALGVQAHVVQPGPGKGLGALAREALAAGEQIVVVAGGDGTISAIAAELADTGKTLGVLPIGTLNHFAKDLRIPLELESAIRTVVHGRVMCVDAAEVNGRIFINNSSLGIYPHVVSRREAQQEHLGRGKWPAFFWAVVQALRRFPFLDLAISFEGKQLARRTAFLFVGNNEYQIAGFNLGARACLNAGNLGLYLTHRTGRLGLFRLAFHALFARVNQAKDFDAFCVEEARVEARKPRLLVACDGEVEWMNTPLHYRTRKGALRVLVPDEEQAS